jgi:hypothetical protein
MGTHVRSELSIYVGVCIYFEVCAYMYPCLCIFRCIYHVLTYVIYKVTVVMGVAELCAIVLRISL